MKTKKGRPRKNFHEPVNTSFNEVLEAFAGSKYADKKTIEKKRKPKKK